MIGSLRAIASFDGQGHGLTIRLGSCPAGRVWTSLVPVSA